MLIKYFTTLFIVLTIFYLNPCKAQGTATYTSAGVNNLLSNAANWDTAPVANDDIIIVAGETMDVDQDFTCNSLTLKHGSVFFCSGGSILTVGTGGIYNENDEKRVDISSSLQISSSIGVNPTRGTFTDARDGQQYNWVRIGNQEWMAENLKYLPSVVGPGTGSQTDPCFYVSGYDGTVVADAKTTPNYNTYGVLYNWPAAMDGATSSAGNPSEVQGVCPSEWHLPSDAEWTELKNYLAANGHSGTEGTALKATSGWISGNGTDDYGYRALPGGNRSISGIFGNIGGIYGSWWSSTEYSITTAWIRDMSYIGSRINQNHINKDYGSSVRCIRD